jgi:CRP-like cAMP-binding protein
VAQSALHYIRRLNFFPALSEEEKVELAAHSRMRTCRRGELIRLGQGDRGSFWLIKEGNVRLSILGAGGKKITVALLGPGEIIGEMAAAGLEGPTEIAEALTGCVLCAVPVEFLQRFVQRRPELSLHISKLIGLRRRQIANRIQDILFLTVPQRVARLLLRLADEFPGETTSGGRFINIRLTHQEMADLVGSNREAVTLALRRLEKEGLVAPVKRYWVLLDEERLRHEAGL